MSAEGVAGRPFFYFFWSMDWVKKTRILYCDCSVSGVLPAEVKGKVWSQRRAFDFVKAAGWRLGMRGVWRSWRVRGI